MSSKKGWWWQDREEAVLGSGASNLASSSKNADVSRKRTGVMHVTL